MNILPWKVYTDVDLNLSAPQKIPQGNNINHIFKHTMFYIDCVLLLYIHVQHKLFLLQPLVDISPEKWALGRMGIKPPY
jgi:hypothetical protein